MYLIRKFRAFLKSRELFRNWFSSGLKYYLSKCGLAVNRIKLKCDNDKEYTLTRHLYPYIVNAYYDGLIDGVECDEAVYLIIDVGSYRLRLHVNSKFFI